MPLPFPSTPSRGGVAHALGRLVLALLHLTVIATAHAAHQTLAIPRPVSRPYVAQGRMPALRFMEAIPTAPVLLRPIASGPPVAASAPEEAEITLANNEAAASTPPMTGEPAAQPAPIPEPAKAPGQPVPASSPQPILPDDTRRKLQSQDFLPLFRFPGTGNNAEDVTVIVPGVPTPPAPSNLPPSSATYQQR